MTRDYERVPQLERIFITLYLFEFHSADTLDPVGERRHSGVHSGSTARTVCVTVADDADL